jgi:hypothetical protein
MRCEARVTHPAARQQARLVGRIKQADGEAPPIS